MDETVVEYEYDDLYRLKKKDFPSGTDTELEHFANGLLKKMKDASGEKRYYYDAADRLTKIEQGPIGFAVGTDQNYVLEYVWNAASQLTQMKLTVRTQSMKAWAYTYTDDGYLDVVTNADAEATKHEYLTDGRLKKITVKNNQIGKKETREYFYQDTSDAHAYVSNKNKHLRRTLDKKNDGSTVISEFNYELDRAGIRLSMTDKDEKYNAYNYDPLYQLKAETKWSQKIGGARDYQYAYVFDPNGNRIVEHHDGVVQNFVYGDNNEMLSAGGVDFTYDHFGNTKTKVGGSGTTTYTYDFENHLINIDFPNTANDDTHEYDGVGRRMRSKLNGAGDWTNFIFDELTDNLIAEYTLITGTFTIKSLNTWGIGLISTNREGTKRYFHFDGLGSTAALTDFDMNVTDTYVYSAFGITESSSGSSVNPFRFVGQWGYYDDGARGSQSELLLLGVRYYSPGFGRFWSWDPLPNLDYYKYCKNTPTFIIDPSGKLPWIAIILCGLACGFLINSIIANWRACDKQCSGKPEYWSCMIECIAKKICEGTIHAAACVACLLCICAAIKIPKCRELLKKITGETGKGGAK
jgi:RHS repeat-associated protein